MARTWRWVAGIGVLALLLAVVPPHVLRRFLFHPPSSFIRAELEPGVERVAYRTSDGVGLVGYYLAAGPMSVGTVLYFHGNGGAAAHGVFYARELARLGWDVFLAEYRGYGKSDGSPDPEGILLDGDAAIAVLQARGVDLAHVVVHGQSLGGAVASHVLAQHGFAAGILESTFSTLHDVAAEQVGVPLTYIVPGAWALDSETAIERTRAPILQIHGDSDRLIPLALGEALHAHIHSAKELVVVPGGEHNLEHSARMAAIEPFLARVYSRVSTMP